MSRTFFIGKGTAIHIRFAWLADLQMFDEERVPFDFDEVLALMAPKPVLIAALTLDRCARVADVKREVETSKKVYELLGHPEALQFETPMDINRFPRGTQEQAFDWITARAGNAIHRP